MKENLASRSQGVNNIIEFLNFFLHKLFCLYQNTVRKNEKKSIYTVKTSIVFQFQTFKQESNLLCI